MRDKTTLVLIEQLVMILVFALAAALCLQAFVAADHISDTAEARTCAAFLAQNAAEALKSCGGDAAAAAELLGCEEQDTVWRFDEAGHPTRGDAAFLLTVVPQTGLPQGLGQAEIRVTDTKEQLLFVLMAAWGVAV